MKVYEFHVRKGSKVSVASDISTAVPSHCVVPGPESAEEEYDSDNAWELYIPAEEAILEYSEEHSEAYGVPRPRLPPVPRTPEFERQRKAAMGKMSKLAAKCRRRRGNRRVAADAAKACTAAVDPQVAVETERSVILFDWDDTILPTWYLKSVVEPCTPGVRGAPLSQDSPFHEPLRRHAELVAEVLRSARAVGRVAIVTLSMRPWVHASAAQFLPGLDLQELLEELDIPIYYSFEHVHSSLKRCARCKDTVLEMLREGTDVLAACKRSAMKKCLRNICGESECVRQNVLSIGDCETEQNALKDVLWHDRPLEPLERQPICKTLRLLEESGLEELGEQLHIIRAWLPTIMAHRQDFDFNLDEADADCFPQVNSTPQAHGTI